MKRMTDHVQIEGIDQKIIISIELHVDKGHSDLAADLTIPCCCRVKNAGVLATAILDAGHRAATLEAEFRRIYNIPETVKTLDSYK